jgi:glycosyltransferase involved in cell wall biosynthesis
LGHEVVIFGPPDVRSAFNYSLEVLPTDIVLFVFEWTTALQHGDQIDLLRLVGKVPRERRILIDCDGKYNEPISEAGDYNHATQDESRDWTGVCDSLTRKIFQPTLHPLRNHVGTFFFHAYSESWERPLQFEEKDYGMFYVGNNWFRWRQLERVLKSVEQVRSQVGPIGILGLGWDSPAPWANSSISEEAYYSDINYLESLNVDIYPPVHFSEVIDHMGRGVFTPVIYRPLFDRLQLVTCRSFESLAAGTIPLFAHEASFVTEIYGATAAPLVLEDDSAAEKIEDVMADPSRYAEIVRAVRYHLRENHSYEARLRQLIEIADE